MAILDEDIWQDAIEDAQAIAYIREHLSPELTEKFSDEQLQVVVDTTVEQLAESDLLEAEPDADGYVDFPIEELARKVTEQLAAEEVGNFLQDDILAILEIWFDFEEENFE